MRSSTLNMDNLCRRRFRDKCPHRYKDLAQNVSHRGDTVECLPQKAAVEIGHMRDTIAQGNLSL